VRCLGRRSLRGRGVDDEGHGHQSRGPTGFRQLTLTSAKRMTLCCSADSDSHVARGMRSTSRLTFLYSGGRSGSLQVREGYQSCWACPDAAPMDGESVAKCPSRER
jgi:hypothetical protein